MLEVEVGVGGVVVGGGRSCTGNGGYPLVALNEAGRQLMGRETTQNTKMISFRSRPAAGCAIGAFIIAWRRVK